MVVDKPDALDDSQLASIDALHALHDALLPGTVANALRTDFFRECWAGCDLAHIDRRTLRHLPTIDKESIRAAGEAAQNREGVVCNDVLTSGTTGNPLVTIRSDREQKFIEQFVTRQLLNKPVRRYLRGLHFTNPYHGHLISVPAPIHNHRISVYDAGSFEYARRTLLHSHKDADVAEQCSVLSGLERCLRAFTLDTMARYPEGFPPTGLRLVVSYSQYLTRKWRQRFQDTWRVPVIDGFSVSEVFGSANQCLQCGWYHFEPYVVPEVLGAHSGEVMHEGAGLLALTALYPFQQAQPLVRYLTGDLVEVTHAASCRPGTTAILPLGRARYGVPEPGSDAWLLAPSAILEAVDDIAEVKRIARFADVEQVTDPYAIGHPKYRTSTAHGKADALEVKVELALAREVSGQRRAEIASDVMQHLAQGNIRLQGALRKGTVSLAVDCCDDVRPDMISQAHSGGVWSPA
ncbi:hypothetical protein PO883_18390 [Massilia sp. DJPM01]|uniref:hypothetical protein n=1 Tax=Massilia sp. DJPM01 TaxID=3024404 RepID=UPI00259F2B8D|nr:hypothetical protein [Massilia sp. DJPM01]MDM5179168.1 hypothetical protein [Massilia sp. DJPM01]